LAQLLDIYGLLSVIVHGLLLTAQSLTLGGVAFLVVVAQPLAADLGEAGARTLARCRRLTRWSAGAVILIVTVNVAVESLVLADTLDISLVESATAGFALAGCAQVIAAALIILYGRASTRAGSAGLVLSGLALLAAGTATSHAVAQLDNRVLLAVATALHRLCAGSWIGGIPSFLIALAVCRGQGAWRRIGKRFSLLSMLSVGVIAATGVVMSLFYIGSFEALYGTAYGVMVIAKSLLFIGLLGLGAMNFRVVERLRFDPGAPILRLRRFAEVEVGVGIAVLFIAASITSLPPAVYLTNDRVTLADYAQRLAPHWPSFSTPAQASLAIAQLQDELDAEAAKGVPAVSAYVPGGGQPPPRNAANIAWSEYNHHWAGAFVLIMALLALMDRNGTVRWARSWPLLFAPFAGFLAYRDLAEGGLENDIGFFALLRDPEIVQHLFFYSLMAAFGIFEWSVRTGHLRSPRAALAFPLLTATAAAALLTHSHSIANVKDLLLMEVTHVPLALLGLTFAWSRWLELRLVPAEGAIAGWVSRVSFALVGLLLILYREI
jgi:putative copper resistance protein D